MKRILCLVLCICMFIPLTVTASSEDFTPPSLSGNVYSVSTASQLRWISAVTNGIVKKGTTNYPTDPTFKGYTISLKNSITLGTLTEHDGEYALSSGNKWTPIGTESIPFSGVFEGNECSVNGVFVDGTASLNGFFGNVENGVINALTVKGYIKGNGPTGGIAGKLKGEINGCLFVGKTEGEDRVGGIAGEVCGTSTARSKIYLTVSNGIVRTWGGEFAGGIAGYAKHADILSCSCGMSIYSYSLYTAGIVSLSGEGVKISCCNSESLITADGEKTYAGGILGASTHSVDIINSSFSGDVYSSSESSSLCGGIAGSFTGKIENCFVNGGVHSAIYFKDEIDVSMEEKSEDISANESSESNESVSGDVSGTDGSTDDSDSIVSVDDSDLSVSTDNSDESVDAADVCISAGIAAASSDGTVNNCYFSGISECDGLEGDNICPSTAKIKVNNVFYSYGTAYILSGTNNVYHVVALLTSLKDWASANGTDYSPWQNVLGVNDNKPLLKHTNTAGSNGTDAWKVEGTVFTYYTDGKMEDYTENLYGTIETPWVVYRASIRTVNVKEGVTRIGNNAFSSFDNLRTLKLPSTLKEIGNYAFEQCVYLKNFTMPSGVVDIGEGAFRRCKALTSVTLPKGIGSVRKYTFAYCEKLASITIPSSVTFIGNMAFTMCDALVSVNLPQSVREIDSYAFYYCENLTKISLPSLLKRIGEYAFGRCDKLVDFTLPASALVEENAFWSTLPKGDIDSDGKYTAFDYLKIKAHFLGSSLMTKSQIKTADLNYDGAVTMTDYLIIKRILRGQQ